MAYDMQPLTDAAQAEIEPSPLRMRRARPIPPTATAARKGSGRARIPARQSLLAPLPPRQGMHCPECGGATIGNVVETFYGVGIGPEYECWPPAYPRLCALACGRCGRIAVTCQGEQYAPAAPERDKRGMPSWRDVPDYVEAEYSNALAALRAGMYTAVAMLCRKLLLSMPVDLGSRTKDGFKPHVEYLYERGYINCKIKEWVTFIRLCGNDANHQVPPIGRRPATISLMLTTELLRWVYEGDHLPPEYFDGYCGH